MVAMKRVLRYLKDTLSFGIKFNKVENFELQGPLGDWMIRRAPLVICFIFGSEYFS